MAGKRIVVPNYMPALDLAGGPVAGAKLYFYENGTNTLKSIYTSAALTVAHSNPVVANAAGVFPSIFADEAEEFSVAITDASDAPIGGLRNRDNVTPSLVFGQEAAESAADTVFTPDGTGMPVNTVQDKLRQYVNLLDGLTNAERADALTGAPSIDTTAKVNAFLAAHSHVEITEGTFLVDYLDIPATLVSLKAATKGTATFNRRAGADGAMWRTAAGSPRVTFGVFEGIYLVGNGEVGETCGFDLTGFAYATFIDCRARLFKQDGWYTKGVITPTVRQMSNNTFINCIGNENGRDGIRFEGESPLRYENTANVFIGGEFTNNGGWGIYGEVCEATHFYGTCCQNNHGTGGDFYFNSRFCIFFGYIESGAQSIVMGPLSEGCEVKVRSSFPLWNTFVDEGKANHLSVMGEPELERHLFKNPHFADWVGATPAGVTLLGSPVVASYVDAQSPYAAGLQLTLGGNFQGLELSVLATADEAESQFVTLIAEIDTSGVVDPLEMRLYTYDGSSLNTANGQNATLPLPITTDFETFTFDVKFVASVTTPTLRWYLAYGGNSAGGNVVKIRDVRIVFGQTRRAGWPSVSLPTPVLATATQLQAATGGINIHRKTADRLAWDTTNHKLRYAAGTTATSVWTAADGSGSLTPS